MVIATLFGGLLLLIVVSMISSLSPGKPPRRNS
jgi:hypothetical protein